MQVRTMLSRRVRGRTGDFVGDSLDDYKNKEGVVQAAARLAIAFYEAGLKPTQAVENAIQYVGCGGTDRSEVFKAFAAMRELRGMPGRPIMQVQIQDVPDYLPDRPTD